MSSDSIERLSNDWGEAPSPTHVFEKTHFSRPTFCQQCTKFIWGLSKQGMSCRACKIPIHNKCLPLIKDRPCATSLDPKALQEAKALLLLSSSAHASFLDCPLGTKHWAILTHDRELYFFSSKRSKAPSRVIPITPRTGVAKADAPGPSAPYAISVFNPEVMPSPIVLFPEDHGDCSQWLSALQHAASQDEGQFCANAHHDETSHHHDDPSQAAAPVLFFPNGDPSSSSSSSHPFASSDGADASTPSSNQIVPPQQIHPSSSNQNSSCCRPTLTPLQQLARRGMLSSLPASYAASPGPLVVVSVDIQVIEARGVTFKHLPVGVHPYVFLKLLHYEHSTSTLWSSSANPSWLESFQCDFPSAASPVDASHLYVFLLQRRAFGSPINVGYCPIPLRSIPHEKEDVQWYPLHRPEHRHDALVTGFLLCEINYGPPVPELSAPGFCQVTLLSGHNLAWRDRNGLSDPYVVLSYGAVTRKTKAKPRTLNPIWDQKFDLVVENAGEPLVLRVFDRDLIGAHDFMGQVVIPLQDIPPRERHIQKYWLEPLSIHQELPSSPAPAADQPGLRLKITINDLTIRALEGYHGLMQLLLDDDECRLVKLLGLHVSRKDGLATCLVNVFGAQGKLNTLVSRLTTAEVQATTDPAILFRGNTITTKVMDAVQKITGQKFLREAIGGEIGKILGLGSALELDPTRMGKKELASEEKSHKNCRQLEEHCQAILDSVAGAIHLLPPAMMKSYNVLKTAITAKFGATETAESLQRIRCISISSFFFLRLVCPAILSPVLFGLCPTMPSEAAARTLTLVAKILQNLANFVVFGAKEPFMHVLNPFITRNIPKMTQLLETLSEIPVPTTPRVSPAAHPTTSTFSETQIWLEKELAQILSYLQDVWNRLDAQALQAIPSDIQQVIPLILSGS